MANEKSDSNAPRPQLQLPRDEVDQEIAQRTKLGKDLLDELITNRAELDAAQDRSDAWSDFNRDFLRAAFTTFDIADEYSRSGGASFPINPTFSDRVNGLKQSIRDQIGRLESIRGRLRLYQPATTATTAPSSTPRYSRRVFVVHGRDDQLKLEVARVLERLNFEAVILHEQLNRGLTIIEKFEAYADVGFAVALLTPDDVGGLATTPPATPDLAPRARQNVVFELGFFIGKLGRHRVAALHKNGTEILSDFSGVVYTHVDSAGAWKYQLAKELSGAGYDVDLSRVP